MKTLFLSLWLCVWPTPSVSDRVFFGLTVCCFCIECKETKNKARQREREREREQRPCCRRCCRCCCCCCVKLRVTGCVLILLEEFCRALTQKHDVLTAMVSGVCETGMIMNVRHGVGSSQTAREAREKKWDLGKRFSKNETNSLFPLSNTHSLTRNNGKLTSQVSTTTTTTTTTTTLTEQWGGSYVE